MKPKVSIVIVNYNTGDKIYECVKSIIETTNSLSSPTTEVIIVDNASTDGSVLKLLKLENEKISILGNSENLGFAKAVNQAIKKADGEYILLLNPDCKLEKLSLQILVDFADTHQDAGAVIPKLLNSNGTAQASVMPFPTIKRAILEYWLGKKVYSKYLPRVDTPVVVESGVMACFLITPLTLKKVGLLDEKYFLYFEDLDYCKRIFETGLKVYYHPNSIVLHHHGVSGKNLASQENQWKRLIPSSKIYHGKFKHYVLFLILWSGQKIRSIF